MQQNLVSVENSVAWGSQTPLGNLVSTPLELVPQVFKPKAPMVTVENGKCVVTNFIECQVQIMGHFKGVFRARSAESGALKLLWPDIEDGGRGDSLLDSGSMICLISFRECMKCVISYDPQFCLDMESQENSSVEQTLGLARNVKFNFGGMLFYLQLYVFKNPVYKILLGRPFEMISWANIQNKCDGSAIIMLTDESDQKIYMPTLSWGDPKPIPGLPDLEKEEEMHQQNSQALTFYIRKSPLESGWPEVYSDSGHSPGWACLTYTTCTWPTWPADNLSDLHTLGHWGKPQVTSDECHW